MPLLITFLLPIIILLLLYMTAAIFYIYKLHRGRLQEAYGRDWKSAARSVVAAIWDVHGYIYYGYEVVGMENIPTDEPVLFVYYHGAVPIDLYYLIAKMVLLRSKIIHTVADNFLFKVPGFAIICDVMKLIPGTVQTCSQILQEGNMLAIAPGGVYEAQFGDSYYKLMWKNRMGFAKVAVESKVKVIPFFTRNLREAFRTVSWGRRLWLRIYSLTRFPFAPIYGGFPVKLVTYIGKPIDYQEGLSPDQIKLKVAEALEQLINQHQSVPGSITRALLERVYNPTRHKKD
ncbi:Similar to TMEM68: Transmembrane protein 68 (Bos taurus) [Cotesia congregata]|uniref:Similar to TMEM68: Transmembrane protein 68 (Bos taurus) n=1 Tax=Cotesia congregata TaxID=51543 RepID=A0A8J2HA71_COTCN|nr:Similar to TMEM68: Transmembrane protein 68 (Bos taurus) [Cotesia congregata]